MGTSYETPQNPDSFTQVTKGNIAEKFVKTTAILQCAYMQSRCIPAVTHIKILSAEHVQTKCLCAVLLNANLVPRAHVPFGQHQDMEHWNNQFPETKILRLLVSWHMRALIYLASRDDIDVDAFHKGIQYTLEKLGKSKFGFERTAVSNFISKRHEGSGNELC